MRGVRVSDDSADSRASLILRLAIAALLALTGVVWILQGIGLLPGSFMTGDPTWAYIGAALLVVAVFLAASVYVRRGGAKD